MDRRQFLARLTALGLVAAAPALVPPRRRLWPGWTAPAAQRGAFDWDAHTYRVVSPIDARAWRAPFSEAGLFDPPPPPPAGVLHMSWREASGAPRVDVVPVVADPARPGHWHGSLAVARAGTLTGVELADGDGPTPLAFGPVSLVAGDLLVLNAERQAG